MKRLTYLLIFVASLGYSQSNLIFNEVKNIVLPAGPGGVTVPDGKVWKIESINNSGANYKASINVDGEIFNIPQTRVFWLNSGSNVSRGDSSLSSGLTQATLLNVIEFIVVNTSTGTGGGSGGLSSEGLEFNQVINYSGDGYLTYSNRSEILTSLNVPENKVWKITNVAMSRKIGTALGDNDGLNAQLGNQIIYSRYISGYSPPTVNYPIWISSGNHDLTISDDNQNGLPYRISISAIEYNIPQ
jgi:hypothetical protein